MTKSVQKNLPTTAEIQAWLVSYLAELLEIEPDKGFNFSQRSLLKSPRFIIFTKRSPIS
ncbi:MAG: hypothetical protein HC862_18490 [Scytonema sp. RU_4_4]|nr:hypothetical protein [Scytonema sp. RU_4_4]